VWNASKIMNKEAIKGGESFFYGLGSIRAKLMPELKSLSKLKSKQEMLVSTEEFKTIAAENDALFDEILDEIGVRAAKDLGDYMAGKRHRGFDFVEFNNISDETVNKIKVLKEKLKETPTEYFEAKFTRPVGLYEFSAAIVPHNVSKETIDILNNAGVTTVLYDETKGETPNRNRG